MASTFLQFNHTAFPSPQENLLLMTPALERTRTGFSKKAHLSFSDIHGRVNFKGT